jgi:exportin-2 (importin alpha re-exporter)
MFSEFIPYTFQILSLLLDFHTAGVPGPYMALFPCLLAPVLWERPGNITPLVKLLQAYISKGPQQVVATDKVVSLGKYLELISIASRSISQACANLEESFRSAFDHLNN